MSSRRNFQGTTASRLFVACIACAIVLSGCSSPSSSDGDASIGAGDRIPASSADPKNASMSHAHGIGRNPADGDVYVATHHGLWRLRDGDSLELVGRHLHDFMGFSVVGPDHFVASGHPNSVDGLPPHLGLIESKDGGTSWTSRSLLGEADFHALRVVGDTTYGWNSQDSALMVSTDRRAWKTLVDGAMMLDVAVDPATGETLLASSAKDQTTLELRRSTDSGRSFTTVEDAPQLMRFVWPEPEQAWGFGVDGTVWMSDDTGSSWKRVGSVKAPPDAASGDADELIVAAGGKLLASTDAGRSWDELASYEEP